MPLICYWWLKVTTLFVYLRCPTFIIIVIIYLYILSYSWREETEPKHPSVTALEDTYCYTVFSGGRSSWPHRGRRTCWTHAPGWTPGTVWGLWRPPRLGTPSGHPMHARPGPATPPSDCHTGPPYHRWATRASALQLEGAGNTQL